MEMWDETAGRNQEITNVVMAGSVSDSKGSGKFSADERPATSTQESDNSLTQRREGGRA
jgi:hypothetical protein